MLVDLPDWLFGPNCPATAKVEAARAKNPNFAFELFPIQRVAQGVYTSWVLSHDLELADIEINHYPFSPLFDESLDQDAKMKAIFNHSCNDGVEDYGVCDNYEQVLERWPQIESDPREFILVMSPLSRETDPGWRWHKNGTYIGTQEPRSEHLGDEPIIEHVSMFHLYEITKVPDISAVAV